MIEPKRARAWLKALKEYYEKEPEKNPGTDLGEMVEALEMALDAVAPPIGAGHCEWVYLPDKDLTPYEHIGLCTSLENEIDGVLSDYADYEGNPEDYADLTVASPEELKYLLQAVMIYKSILMTMNKDRMREEVEKAVKARKEGTDAD